VVESEEFKKKYPRKVSTAPFLVIDGFIDFLLPSMASGSSGAITGIANFAPVCDWKNSCFICPSQPFIVVAFAQSTFTDTFAIPEILYETLEFMSDVRR